MELERKDLKKFEQPPKNQPTNKQENQSQNTSLLPSLN